MLEKRLLQLVVLLASCVPITAGLAGIIAPPSIFGAFRYSMDLVSHFSYLSGLLLAIGIAFVISVPNIEKHRARFLMLGGIIFLGGLARLFQIYLTGWPSAPHQFALVMELIITPAIVAWQISFAKRHKSG